MMPLNWLLLALSLACGAVTGFGAGWQLGRAPLQTRLAEQTVQHATQQAQALQAAVQTLTQAQAKGDALSSALIATQTQIVQLQQEKHYAVTQATTGSACLRGPALRLLNAAPGLHVAGLPAATSGAVAADGALAADPFASDRDITGWAIDAGAQYGVCRARLDALIDWHQAP